MRAIPAVDAETESPPRQPEPGPLILIMITAFLNLMGIGLIGPVLPFLVSRYVSPDQLALANGLLFTSLAVFQFLAVPGLGALSDRYGRRPVLLVSLFGSAVGYILFGIGGALWVLFLGRIIDGVTGGNLSTIFAYVADITDPRERTRYFGLIGSVSGLGFVIGPAIGGALSRINYEAPLWFAAFVTLATVALGYFRLPESLPAEKRRADMGLAQLNPFAQLWAAFRLPRLRWLFVSVLLLTLPFAVIQSNLSVLGKDRLGAGPEDVSVIFFIFGAVSILVQGQVIRRLLPILGEGRMTLLGMGLLIAGFLLIALAALTAWAPLLVVAACIAAAGNSLALPALTGLISNAVGPSEQGVVQGGNQSMQALGRVLGPVWAGVMYSLGSGTPYWTGAALLGLGTLSVVVALRQIGAGRRQ